ncbi:MAG: FAD-dependent oxidoreductase, partial [Rhodospirillales bacterium]|nr:FAD-dependent oxidoreductase [Rhodospirillales bacterium]
MRSDNRVEVAIVGAGIAGIATAYYLSVKHKESSVFLIDWRAPMSYTSAQSGDNFRNWWPHPTMTAFTNDSIDLMRGLAIETDNLINMTDRGYVLATRR